MFLKNLLSLIWYFVIFITLLINLSLGSEILIKRDLSLNRNNVPKNILVTSMVGKTHLRHMLEICLILIDRGYNVTLIAPGNYTAKSNSYRSIPQIIFENEPLGLDNKSSEINKAFLDDDYTRLSSVVKKVAILSYVSFYNIYKQVAEEINVDLFFCDYVMNYPCFDLAWKLGKPVVGSSTDHSYLPHPPYLSDPIYGCHVNMENESFYNRFKCAIIIPLKHAWSARDTIKGINAQRALVDIDPFWDIRGRISSLLMLSNNFFGFEIPRADTPLHQEIGPVLPDTFPGLTPALDSFLAAHPRTLYFALGTLAIMPPQSVISLLTSFLELIEQDVIDGVIWSTVKTNISDSFQLANSNSLLFNILNNIHPHFHICKYSPQFAILSHENTKLFLSHGGAASCHESMYTATPMLVLPMMSDQFRNAEKLELAGIALKISKTNLNVDDIILKVKRLLFDQSFKKNAERLQFLAKVNSKRKYRAADLIEIVLNTVKYEGIEDDNGKFKINNENLLRDWITPDSRMGFIRGTYLDVYAVAIILFLTLSGGFVYALWKITIYFYIKYRGENGNSQRHLKHKEE